MIVLGLNEGHNASASLAVDGEIITAAQEERFTRVKNQPGLPLKSIKFCLDFAKIDPTEIDLVVFTGTIPNYITNLKKVGLEESFYLKSAKFGHHYFRTLMLQTEYHFPQTRGIDKLTIDPVIKIAQKIFFPKTAAILEKEMGIPKEKHVYLDHHTAHAYSGLYSSPFHQENKGALVITCDAGGDGNSSTISAYKDGKLKRLISAPDTDSLGVLYGVITDILGMKPLEHEYKVMGLAPYAEEHGTKIVYEFLKTVIRLNRKTLAWETVVTSDNLNRYVREHLPKCRFDHIAGAIQKLTEELLCQWISLAIDRFKIRNIVFSGGVAQNVKANQKIAALKSVKEFFAMPSAGDESNAIGAAYWGSKKIDKRTKLKPVKNFYLGPEYGTDQIENVLKRKNRKYKVEKIRDPQSKIAQMLALGKIVARFSGRTEFGARALGNRSILADPTLPQVTDTINRQIKSRDFWMPFAPTILKEDEKKYLVNPKNVESPYMTIAFDTKSKSRDDIKGAIHPFDYTCRPQLLKENDNLTYYKLLQNFKKLTGRGAILNTSFNLHGDPIVNSPEDALYTFGKSQLQYLMLENFLISK